MIRSSLHYIEHLFLPHHSNNHRPRILHSDVLMVILLCLTVVQVSLKSINKIRPDILGFATNIVVDALLEKTNQERLANGLSPVQLNAELSEAAAKKANDMFAKDYWAHTAPDGTTPWDFILGAGYRYTFAGENLARDFDDSASVVIAWMNSPSHRDNLLRPEYEEIGFAVVNGKLNGNDTTLVVQMFGTRNNKTMAQQTVPTITIAPTKTRTASSPGVLVQVQPSIIPHVTITQEAPSTNAVGSLSNIKGFVINKPVINLVNLEKLISYWLIGLFAGVIVLDGFIIWRRKTIRMNGHNLAHFVFLVFILGFIIVGTNGSIL